MNDNTEFRDVRLFYTKTGRAKYISHLDVMRAFQRAFQRTKIDFWYTEGFHPHLYLTFALPLSLGYESICESVDFRVLSDITYTEMEEKFKKVLPEGFSVISVSKPVMQAKEIRYSDYDINFKYDGDDLSEIWESCFLRDSIPVIKKSKSGEKEVDIKKGIELSQIVSIDGAYRLLAKLVSGTETNYNPDLLFSAFESYSGIKILNKRIIRTAVYNEKMQKFK